MSKTSILSKNESGQALTEYVLLLALVAAVFGLVSKGLLKTGIGEKFSKALTTDFAAIYQYGHPKAKGYDDGGPQYHPRAPAGGTNFRIFINPDLGGG